MIAPILQIPDKQSFPQKYAEVIRFFEKPAIFSPVNETSLCVARDLVDTLENLWRQGRICTSICAKHIGINENILAFSKNGHINGKIEVLFNPVVVCKRDEFDFWEDNANFPGKMFKVSRPYEICVEYQDSEKVLNRVERNGKVAALIMQEIDNLCGILPTDRAMLDAECGVSR